ncbi:MAG TPA: hypothetical protein VHE30_03945 [Polyangiaceae bacterium]|nr:hypothetical protein [Polyangiaceae bacterium]
MVAHRFVLVALVCSVACGGVVQTGEPGPTPTPSGGAGAASAGGGSSGSSDHLPTVDLPECKKGRSPESGAAPNCPYEYDGLCWDAKLDACGCACVGIKDSTCASGFPDSVGTVTVSCF